MQVILDDNWLHYLPSLFSCIQTISGFAPCLVRGFVCALLSQLIMYGCMKVPARYRTDVKPLVWQIPNKIQTSCTFKPKDILDLKKNNNFWTVNCIHTWSLVPSWDWGINDVLPQSICSKNTCAVLFECIKRTKSGWFKELCHCPSLVLWFATLLYSLICVKLNPRTPQHWRWSNWPIYMNFQFEKCILGILHHD